MPDGNIYMENSIDHRNSDTHKLNNSDNHTFYKHEVDKSQQVPSKSDVTISKGSEAIIKDLDIFLGLNHNHLKNWELIERKISNPLLETTLPDFSDCDLVSNDSDSDGEDDFEDVTLLSGDNHISLKIDNFKNIGKLLKTLPQICNNGVILDPSKFIDTIVFWDWDGNNRVQLDNSINSDDSKYDFVFLSLKKSMAVTLMARHKGWVYARAQGSKLQGWFPWYMLVSPSLIINHI